MPSDSTSTSIFSPPQNTSPRRARGESRASLASNAATRSISHPANEHAVPTSVVQDLTSFSDLTEPPPSTSQPENKGLTGDIQGGLSGLYSKFKATVGGVKDSDRTIATTPTIHTTPGTNTSTTSGMTSLVQSSHVLASDTANKMELSMSRFNPKAGKLAMSSPGLRSPNAATMPANLADPALTELTIHATSNVRSHSRAGSSQGLDDSHHSDRSVLSPSDEQNLRKVLSKIDHDSRSALPRHERQPPSLTRIDTKISTHSRNNSEVPAQIQKPKDISKSHHVPQTATKDDPLINVVPVQHESPIDRRSTLSPLDLLADHDSGYQITDSVTTRRAVSPTSQSKISAPRPAHKVSHSKLPGFQGSRASSTDSGRTSGILAVNKDTRAIPEDGYTEEYQYTHYPRPSSRLRSRLLAREFWMKDENARDCFRCGELFTTFRRKHHCRICGQIFDNKCTALVSGTYFDLPGPIRVCKPCEAIITFHDDDSSDYSEDTTAADLSARPRTPDHSLARYDDDNVSMVSQSLEHISRTPVMNYPVRRAFDKSNRSSAIFEFDAPDRGLHRPSSSRSLRTAHAMTHGHKRHHSKHTHIRSLKPYHEERVPFQRQNLDDVKGQRTSAFHRDSVIDPELAQYLSDDASSDDEPILQPSASSEKLSRSGPDNDRTTISSLLAAVRKGRSRIGDRSIAGFLNLNARDADDAASLVSARAIDGSKPSRKRNLSVASSVHTRPTPRATRERLQIALPVGAEADATTTTMSRGSRMIRSASMHGLGAPKMELNRASLQHVHKMLRQLLNRRKIQKISSWENALMPILLRATDDVDPDVQGGDDLDIRHYVKLKKIPGGRPMDTSYTSGYIFSKNVALKSMQRTILRPRILIITFPIEYARTEAHFMSLDPVIRQEREYLQNLVSRIAALKPDVLLAQRNISGLALELLDKANIAVVYNVKPSVLEAVSRCTDTAQYSSMDKLALPAEELGTCELFEVRTYLTNGRRKNYIYLSGCDPKLGCTIALRGAPREVLIGIKEIADFMIYVVYNLKLETCLMRDEWASLPLSDESGRNLGTTKVRKQSSPSRVSNENTVSSDNQIHAQGEQPFDKEAVGPEPESEMKVKKRNPNENPKNVPTPKFYQYMADEDEDKVLSSSPFVKFSPPYLKTRAQELEKRVNWLQKLRNQDLSDSVSPEEKAKQKFTLIVPEMVHNPFKGASRKVREIVHAVHNSEYEKALDHYHAQRKLWDTLRENNFYLFQPEAHQQIVVLFSTVSTFTHVPCLGPEILAFNYYDDSEASSNTRVEADCTLGQYVEDLCYRANDICPALESCGKRMHEHQRQYVHGEAQVTVCLEPYPPKLRGMQDVILMWSTCKICGTETTVTPMSQSTWKYSFAKYLELSFWSADLHARAGICHHDLHRDHLRYFGYRGFALRVHYDAINLLEVVVPHMLITWKVDNDLLFRNEVFTKLEHRITRFMVSVKLRLKSINVEALLPESAEPCRSAVERLTQKANEDHIALIKLLQEQYTNSRHWEVIPLNLAMRLLQQKVAEWDEAFLKFEKDFFPSEKDIRRLATLQLKRIFLDRDVSVTSLTSTDELPSPTGVIEPVEEKDPESPGTTRKLSPEKTQNVLQSVMEEHIGSSASADDEKAGRSVVPVQPQPVPTTERLSIPNDLHRASTDLGHLDLAVSGSLSKSATVPEIEPSDISPRDNGSEAIISSSPKERSNIHDKEDDVPETKERQASADEVSGPTAAAKEQLSAPGPPVSRRSTISRPNSPMLTRAQSQPLGSVPQRKDSTMSRQSTLSALNALNGFGSGLDRKTSDAQQESSQKKLSERFGLSQSKHHKSLIPRAISNRKDSRVSNLAKHFEQLTREFEQARLRERRLKASTVSRSQIYPSFAPKPTVEVYNTVDEAVSAVDDSEETLDIPENNTVDSVETTAQAMAKTNRPPAPGNDVHEETDHTDTAPSAPEPNVDLQPSSHAPSDTEDKTDTEDDEIEDILLPDSPEDLLRLSKEDVEFKELPKHERTSLMKLLTNFWAERSSSGWSSLEYPLSASDHIFQDCDIIVREDELSSLIAFALDSEAYKARMQEISAQTTKEQLLAMSKEEREMTPAERSMKCKNSNHLRYAFTEKDAKMLCKVFFAEQFDAMRQKCGVAERFVESMSRCMKFDSRGGKSKSLFLKTLDDRFVLKSLSPVETQSFLKFAPQYFSMVSEAFFHGMPSVIAKMLGFYQIIVKNPATGVEHNWFLLVMENLFYDRVPTRIFDLKGSMRNRKVNATGERNEVLLDENMVDYIYESPLFTREHSKLALRNSVYNDTLFLERMEVMDYSLMIAIDEARKELVIGIIDCIRTYTWDKKLESWIKDRGFIGAVASGVAGAAVSGQKNRPTVTSPKEYKKRFREAMIRYVLEAPSCWSRLRTREEEEEERRMARAEARRMELEKRKKDEHGHEEDLEQPHEESHNPD
ncbi:Mitochondrial distribution and morphology protein 12 [Lithohypha guttulata]|uniref:Mitochondrial distribution and morphology protein 12 n=1 Tax=Lithohypha guttulata TaxID=1690604 RepID=UPI00315DF032